MLPMYASQRPPSGKAAKILGATEDFSGVPPTPKNTFHNYTDLLDPALDGPPSPERLRQLSQEMRRGSHADIRRGSQADIRRGSEAGIRRGSQADIRRGSIAEKHQSQHTTSSGSSSLLSTSDRPSWEHGLDQLTLSRKSSQRSTTSSMPSRGERPESLQIFGKTLFNRRGKLRRESSDQGSSNSSLQSSEVEPSSVAPKESQPFLKDMLARRKGKGDAEAAPKRIQISGPYNFQHLTHSQNDNINDYEDTMIDLSDPRYARRPTDPFPHGLRSENLHFANFSSESLTGVHEDPSAGVHARKNSEVYARPLKGQERAQTRQNRYTPPVPIRPLVKRAQSEEQMRGPPPRPPRSPIGASFSTPHPPPRLSSRTPSRDEVSSRNPSRDEIDPLERPMTNCSSRQPAPFILSPAPSMPEPPATAQGLMSDFFGPNDIVEQQIGSHAITTPDDAAWPLTANVMTALPDVPEEEESSAATRADRVSSLTSNNSSLRGSVSVPILRQRPQVQSPGQHGPSNASETLGKFDMLAAQRLMRESMDEEASVYEDNLNWEDDIDYCYEHAAEADFDYAWERPSCDMTRDGGDEEAQSPKTSKPKSSQNSAHLFLRNRFDVPALSPASQTSMVSSQGVITPTLQQGNVTSNFSLPRRDSSTLTSHKHTRVPSRVSAFKESQGFISPSLLIPNDYHQQMLLHESEFREEDEDDEAMFLSHGTSFLDPSDFKSANARASSSTTHSALSDQSTYSSRHKSANSAYTRWTASSAATSIESWQAPNDDSDNTVSKTDSDNVSPLPVFEDPFKRDSRERHGRAMSHANVLAPNETPESAAVEGPSPTLPSKSRRRARTTSRSHNNPPAQFGLFPSVPTSYANLPGGRI
ncbi:pak-box p21-rho-binding protein [Apiospora arundinis]|uniref:Pak-box p21-rho-binding protein n=1 Tax=Apiospora arundinis TaxID=335852 RepID=A0ABR2HLP2_9PEZI